MRISRSTTHENEHKDAADRLSAFALDLYARLKDRDGNLFYSPLSISTCLAMAYAGARGETARQMAQALHFPLDQDHLHPALGGLLERLNAESRMASYRLVVANALWGQQGYGFVREFMDLLVTKYGSGLHEVDFAMQTEAAREVINRWVEEQTQEKIREVIGQDMLDPSTRLVLTNAIYFKGNWRSPFDQDATDPAPFRKTGTHPGSDWVEVSMMAQTNSFRYLEAEDFQALELPYDGKALSMVIFLPRRFDGLLDLERSLTVETLQAWVQAMHKQEIEVFVPKFKMSSGFALGEMLRSMGMSDAFTFGTADFSGMVSGGDFAIEEVIHKAFVEVNEEGTEAAAATGLDLCLGEPEDEPAIPVFRADHPFLFLIRDLRSGSILFMGRVVDPTSGE